MNLEEWKSQIKRGTLEFCILLLIQRKPRYGYELISQLERWPMVATKESTIYPLLRRLLKEGCLDSFWQETTQGLPPRKYYSMTQQGRAYLEEMSAQWRELSQAIAAMGQGGDEDDGQAVE